MNEQLLSQARAIGPDLHTIFQEIHEHPELGNREERTAALIRRRLEMLGWEVTPVVGTGTVGLLRGDRPGPTLSLIHI